jgi:hypothetical protein
MIIKLLDNSSDYLNDRFAAKGSQACQPQTTVGLDPSNSKQFIAPPCVAR